MWINSKDRLPETGILVLVFTDEQVYRIAYRLYGWYDCYEGIGLSVLYWMPLPKAPILGVPEDEDEQGYRDYLRGM